MDPGEFRGARKVLLEISKPDKPFANPNGTVRDPNSLRAKFYALDESTFLVPRKDLPSKGTYYLRLLATDSNGKAVGRFSNPSVLVLEVSPTR